MFYVGPVEDIGWEKKDHCGCIVMVSRSTPRPTRIRVGDTRWVGREGRDMRIARLAVVALAVVALVTGCGVDMSAGNSFEPGQAQLNPQPGRTCATVAP